MIADRSLDGLCPPCTSITGTDSILPRSACWPPPSGKKYAPSSRKQINHAVDLFNFDDSCFKIKYVRVIPEPFNCEFAHCWGRLSSVERLESYIVEPRVTLVALP